MKAVIYAILFLGVLNPTPHDFHVSILNMEYNAKSKNLECSFKIFIDDLEKALMENGAPKLNLNTKTEHAKTNYYIVAYLRKHFKVKQNGSNVTYNVIGKEYEEDVCWVYVETDKVKDMSSLLVRNTLLFNTFSDQANIVHVKHPDKGKKSVFLRVGEPEGTVHF